MPVIWLTEINYNWEKNANKLQRINTAKTISCFNFSWLISMWLVAITAKGANVNSNKSLLLFEETTKITIPIKKEAIIFLNEECSNKGLFESDANIEITKNKAIVK